MVENKPLDLAELAKMIRHGIHSSFNAVTVGGAPQVTQDQFQRMLNPVVGDLVSERSTVFMSRGTSDLDAVGVLEEIADEPVQFSDPDFVWDEELEGAPRPKETVYYIRTLDGRRFRWSNASFIAAGELDKREPSE